MNNTDIFICPICKTPFSQEEKSFLCKKGHCFDISSSGYINLLPVHKMHSKIPGDTKEMVLSRKNFLSKGYYAPLKNEICKTIEKYAENEYVIFDCGCGEGYYTEQIQNTAEKFNGKVYGADISKTAAEKAAKRSKETSIAVASAYDLPIKNESIDFLTDIFSPLALNEFRRILKSGGYFLYVVPAEKHLFKMKSILYENPYENIYSKPEYIGFEYIEIKKVSFKIYLKNNEDILSLFNMTPYFWRTPKEGVEKLKKETELYDIAEFYIHLMKKI